MASRKGAKRAGARDSGGSVSAAVRLAEYPEAPLPAQHQRTPGLEARLDPKPIFEAPAYRAAGKLAGTVRELGALDILVNNAAFQHDVDALEDLDEEQFERTFRTNIFGYFYMPKAALPHLGEGAAIVNTGSITGVEGAKDLLDSSATKGAIHAFTKSLAQNLVEREIRVHCVAPGPVWTPLNPQAKPARKIPESGKSRPMKRPAQPEEIAPVSVFFASSADSSCIAGEVLTLLGCEKTAA